MYFLFTTETPIKAESLEKISKLGCIVPYDSGFEDLATYGYYPQDISAENKKQLQKLTKGLVFTKSEIKLEEIQRQARKLQTLNAIKQGDIVKHRDYRNLPFIVTLTDGTQATIFHNLRGRSLVLVCAVEYLQVLPNDTEIKTYKVERDTITYRNSVYLDCDIFSTRIADDYYRDVFLSVLALKIAFISSRIVLVNPFRVSNDLIDLIGLECVKGNLLAISQNSPDETIISNSKILNHEKHKTMPQHPQTQEPQYIVDKKTDTDAYRYGLTHNKRNIKDMLVAIKNGHAQPIQCVLEFDKECVRHEAKEPRDKLSIVKQLKKIGLDSMTTRIHDIVYLITGRNLTND